MKTLWKIIWPGLFGLFIYAVIRILNDTISEFRVWERNWVINCIEIGFSIGVGYLVAWGFKELFKYFDQKHGVSITFKTILKEILWVCIFCEVVMSVTILPMAAFTDDGLSWGDAATIYIIPALFCIIFYGIARSKKLLQAYVDSRLQLERIQKDSLETELKFLKAQYHPHFLFNALNTIYFQMDDNTQAAKKSIEKFSELLRYQLYDQHQTVPVTQEIHYLENFIALQKVRSSEKLRLDVHFDKEWNGQTIYPLLFLPLVENAFKYVGGDYGIRIVAQQQDENIFFRVENNIPPYQGPYKNGGIGLENLSRRLELLYPGKHRFNFGENNNWFVAELELNITN